MTAATTVILESLGQNGVSFATATPVLHGGGIAPLGDANGDGIDDFLVGFHDVYLVFGTRGVFTTDLDLLGDGGLQITTQQDADFLGFSSGSIGDFNGDGIEDFGIGRPYSSANAQGAADLVFGQAGRADDIALDSASDAGVTIVGQNATDLSGTTVLGPGDFNGDGFDDVFVYTYLRNQTDDPVGGINVVFGTAAATPTLGRIFGVPGNVLGFDFGGGDINNDGLADLVLSMDNNLAHIVLGGQVDLANDLGITQLGAAKVTFSGPTGFGQRAASPVSVSLAGPPMASIPAPSTSTKGRMSSRTSPTAPTFSTSVMRWTNSRSSTVPTAPSSPSSVIRDRCRQPSP
ncbi:MAG: VCBS repeat-containing protein [Alphaproteobacteria bacterium]